ncbi:MAG: alr [Microbacteriaceae bacterium]|jgi:alanine racemase|nr:alr [Microbacteriaceae bacterium]HEV7955957.1 alanine racemase [Marisediminicola sp.]
MTARPMREARVHLDAISANVETLRRLIRTDHAMAVVKARGYGHGAVPSARAALAGGADWLGVVDIVEALELRDAGITAPILAWLHDPHFDFAPAIVRGIDVGIGSLQQLHQAASAGSAASGIPDVHLKVDTGLGRGGIGFADCEAVFAAAADHERNGRLRVRGLFSHLANAGAADDAAQVAAFEHASALAFSAGLQPELRHLAATAGALRVPAARFDLVRLGIGIYGLSPFDDQSGIEFGLRPALELSAAIVSVKRVPAGTGVSYGHRYRTTSATTLALVPLGYAEGIPRQASNRGPVSINGRVHRIAGSIAMDQFVVDVGDASVAVGDRAVLFGDPAAGAPSAEDWATASDTINYEIVTRLGGRLEYRYWP